MGTCYVCGDEVPVDGEQAMERWGDVLCWECADEPVVFRATCSSQFCDWSFTVEDTEFNRGHARTRASQEATFHENRKRVFDGDEMHRTAVEEVAAGGE